MSIVTTYVCDVSGKSGQDRRDFVDVSISVKRHVDSYRGGPLKIDFQTAQPTKIVHIDIAKKLNLLNPVADDPVPEITFESRLSALVRELVVEEVEAAMENR